LLRVEYFAGLAPSLGAFESAVFSPAFEVKETRIGP
jgi:hypothetical protein